MNDYTTKILIEDFYKKISLYHNKLSNKYDCCTDRYDKLLEFLETKNFNDLALYYRDYDIKIENNIVYIHDTSDLNGVLSRLYEKLYFKNSDNAFDKFIQKLDEIYIEDGFLLSFYYEEVKNDFLIKATQYVINDYTLNRNFKEEILNIDFKRYDWLNPVEEKEIPNTFDDLQDLYFWWQKQDKELLYIMENNIFDALIYNIIELDTHNMHAIHDINIVKILKKCQNDYVLISKILFSNNLKLNCFFLSKNEYFLFGFLNLYDLDSHPHNLVDEYNYTKEWQELLVKQLINIIFKYFKFACYKKQYPENIYFILNAILDKHFTYFDNPNHYKANYTIKLFLEKLKKQTLLVEHYQTKSLLEITINKLVDLQTNKKKFTPKDIFLLNWYLEQLNDLQKITNNTYKTTIEKIVNPVFDSLKSMIENGQYLDIKLLKYIDFGLFYKFDTNKDRWLDFKVNESNSVIYFLVLKDIFLWHRDKNIANKILNTCFEYGFNEGSFFNKFYDEYILLNYFWEISNYLDKESFDNLVEQLYNKKLIRYLLELYENIIIENRKQFIIDKIQKIKPKEIKIFFKSNLIIAYEYAVSNNLQIAEYLLNLFPNNDKEFVYVKCKSDLINIYKSNMAIDKKLDSLNSYKINIDDKNWGVESKHKKCEEFKDFIRAVIWFETEPFKTYQILKKLLLENPNRLYLVNMLNAYFKAYENDDSKKEKFKFAIEEYFELLKEKKIETLFEYRTLLYGYFITNDIDKFYNLWEQMPVHYGYNIDIINIKCEFLKQNNNLIEAKKYLDKLKKLNLINIEDLQKIEEKINTNLLEKKDILKINLDFTSTTLTIEKAKQCWLEIKEMDTQSHAKIIYRKNSLEELIFQIMKDVSIEILERKTNLYRTNGKLEIEDIINDWITTILKQKMAFLHWSVMDQSRGGQSNSGKSPGERDIVVSDKNQQRLFIFEAFKLNSLDKTKIEEHLNKLDGYNSIGCKLIIVMVYCDVEDFKKFSDSYKGYISSIDYKGFCKNNDYNINEKDSESSNIRIFCESRYKNNDKVLIYNYLLNLRKG